MRLLLTLALVVPFSGASGVVPPARAQTPAPPVQAPSLPGPLESRAVPTGADNPVPTRTRTVAAEYPEARRKLGGNITPPKRIKDVPPVYPPVAQSARVEGIVILEATIGPDGRVADVRVLRSIPLLDQAAIDAVRQWEFTPTMMDGVPTAVIMSVTINFTLGERGGAPAAPGNTAPPPP